MYHHHPLAKKPKTRLRLRNSFAIILVLVNTLFLLKSNVRPSVEKSSSLRSKTSAISVAVADNKHNKLSTTTTTPSSSSCSYRICKEYNNVIIYNFIDQQGLSDRLWIFEQLLNLAGYLCAKVYVMKPHHLLSQAHLVGSNGKVVIDTNLTWSDFVSYRWKVDPSPHSNFNGNFASADDIININKNNSIVAPPRPPPALLHEFQNPSDGNEFYIRFRNQYSTSLVLTSPPSFPQQFEQIQRLSFQDDEKTSSSFLWLISLNWYELSEYRIPKGVQRESPDPMALPAIGNPLPRGSSSSSSTTTGTDIAPLLPLSLSSPCGHYILDRNQFLPDDMQYLVDSIWSTIIIPSSLSSESNGGYEDYQKTPTTTTTTIVGSLHVRRGDTTHLCDTTVSRVWSYLECSLQPLLSTTTATTTGNVGDSDNDDKKTTKITVILLFASDERDANYRNQLMKQQQQLQQQHHQNMDGSIRSIDIQWIDLDELVATHIRNDIAQGRLPSRLGNNNYYIFRIQNAIRDRTEFQLQLRREWHCHDCDPVMLL